MCGPNSEMGNETKVGLQILRKLISLGVNVNVTDHEDRYVYLIVQNFTTRW